MKITVKLLGTLIQSKLMKCIEQGECSDELIVSIDDNAVVQDALKELQVKLEDVKEVLVNGTHANMQTHLKDGDLVFAVFKDAVFMY